MYKCPLCSYSHDKLLSLSIHYRNFHNRTSKELSLELFYDNKEPVCKCGCGQKVAFLSLIKGFGEYIRGHASKVHNNWGHNKTAIEKSIKTRQENWQNGVYQIWSKGLTKKTDERLVKTGMNVAASVTDAQRRERSARMKTQRLNGVIPTLHREHHSQWKGGISSLNAYCHASNRLYREWKWPKMKEANFTCHECHSQNCELQVHHDKESFSEIMRVLAEKFGWAETYSKQLPESIELQKLKEQISNAIVDYHLSNNVSGVVLCIECHHKLHTNLNFNSSNQ